MRIYKNQVLLVTGGEYAFGLPNTEVSLQKKYAFGRILGKRNNNKTMDAGRIDN